MADLHTDVLVVGSGPAGSAAALAPATYGVPTTVITEYGRLAGGTEAEAALEGALRTVLDRVGEASA